MIHINHAQGALCHPPSGAHGQKSLRLHLPPSLIESSSRHLVSAFKLNFPYVFWQSKLIAYQPVEPSSKMVSSPWALAENYQTGARLILLQSHAVSQSITMAGRCEFPHCDWPGLGHVDTAW